MLKSMTGFGRWMGEERGIPQLWEIRSVNGRHLDIKWRLPSCARSMEARFEKLARRLALRGRIDISLSIEPRTEKGVFVRFNAPLAEAMLQLLEDFARTRGDMFTPGYADLMNCGFLWEDKNFSDEDDVFAALEMGFEKALLDWDDSRSREGAHLAMDLSLHFQCIGEWVSILEESAPKVKAERFAALRGRLADALTVQGLDLPEGRFLQEVVILADKLDVSEELSRLHVHIGRLVELLAAGGDAGRKLDFTLQEAFREITTCGNKIQDASLSVIVVDIKNELEKCREQVQNIE